MVVDEEDGRYVLCSNKDAQGWKTSAEIHRNQSANSFPYMKNTSKPCFLSNQSAKRRFWRELYREVDGISAEKAVGDLLPIHPCRICGLLPAAFRLCEQDAVLFSGLERDSLHCPAEHSLLSVPLSGAVSFQQD